MSDRRVRQNAVAEIENKRPAGERCENRIDTAVERGAARAQRLRIEIALHRTPLLNDVAREIEIHHPVEPHRIDRNLFDIAPDVAAGAARKPDDFRAGHSTANLSDDALHWRDAPALKLARWQDARPG